MFLKKQSKFLKKMLILGLEECYEIRKRWKVRCGFLFSVVWEQGAWESEAWVLGRPLQAYYEALWV